MTAKTIVWKIASLWLALLILTGCGGGGKAPESAAPVEAVALQPEAPVVVLATDTPLPPTATATPTFTPLPPTPTATITLTPTSTKKPTPDLTGTAAGRAATAEAKVLLNAIYDNTTPPAPAVSGSLADFPAPLGGGGTIVFSSNRAGKYQLFTLAAGETAVTRLTKNSGDTFFSTLSPGGNAVTYFYVNEKEPEYPLQLRQIYLDGTGDEMLVYGPIAGWPSYSPDGKYLLFTGINDDTEYAEWCHDFIRYNLGSGDFELFPPRSWQDGYSSSSAVYSPDGKWIAYESRNNNIGAISSMEKLYANFGQIYLCDAEGRNRHLLIGRETINAAKHEFHPRWSPDGKQIAFAYGGDEDTQIYLVNADGTNLRQVTNIPGTYNESPAWSPDGSLILFWSDRTGNKELFVTTLDWSLVANLTNSGGEDEDPIWIKPGE